MVGFKIGICRLNDQDEKKLKYKFVHLFPERLTTSELSKCKHIHLVRLLWGLLLICMKKKIRRFCSAESTKHDKFLVQLFSTN